jgi:hypothetical protein
VVGLVTENNTRFNESLPSKLDLYFKIIAVKSG